MAADADRHPPDVVTRLGQILGLAAGFVAVVYTAGGGVLALRLYLAHLPSRTIVGQLPRELVISVGLAQVVLPVLGVAAVYAIYRFFRGTSAPPRRLVRQWKVRSWRGWATLVAASAIPALMAAGALAWADEEVRGGVKGLLWLAPATFLLTLLVVLIALGVRARLAERYVTPEKNEWDKPAALIPMTILVALASVPTAVVLAGAYLPLLDAKVCTTTGLEVTGLLIGETSDRTYIGEEERGPTGPLLMFSVPRTQITETFIGGDASSRPCSAVDAE